MKTIPKLLCGAVLAAFACTVNAQTYLTNGLVAYFPLDGNANDASGHGINGVLHNVSPTRNRHGQVSAALNFQDSGGSYVDLGMPVSLQFTGDFTVTAWANFHGGTLNPRIWSYADGYGYEFLTGGVTTNRPFVANFGGLSYSSPSAPQFKDGEWNLVFVRRAGDTLNVFVNGVCIATNTITTVPTFPSNLNLGRKSLDGFDNYWGGAIDEVRFYNRSLSDEELDQLNGYEHFCSPHGAQATATMSGDGVVGATMDDFGCGYTNVPTVVIDGGGGSNATATVTMTNGTVTGVVITSTGSGYTNAPDIYIESPPFEPTVSIHVSKVKVAQRVRVNHNYVLEASTDLSSWNPTGPQFTAQTEIVVTEFDVDLVGRYFRIREVP